MILASAAGRVSADQLLYSLNYNPAGAHTPAYAPQGLQFGLEFGRPGDPPEIVRLGTGVYWPSGSAGLYDFLASGSTEAAVFADRLTNGTDDELLLMTYDDFYGGGGDAMHESAWGFGNPDLAGNQIDLIRLVVHDLSIQPYSNPPYGDGLQWNGHITWEFWGTPVPEPATALPVVLAVLLRYRRRAVPVA
jgi:hypothetical protein